MAPPLSRFKSALRSVPRYSATSSHASSSSFSAPSLLTAKKNQPGHAVSVPTPSPPFPNLPPSIDLFRRISPPIGDPAAPAVPVIERWIEEGGTVNHGELLSIVKNLRAQRRYKHALEVSLWMFEKGYSELKYGDFSIRLDLIGKVNGVEEAEYYFDTIPENLRTEQCYSSLLNCYVRVRDVDKADNTMQKMRDLGFARSTLSRNKLLSLYYQTQNHEKLENLVREMQEEGIEFNSYTFSTLISAYAATSNTEGIEKLLAQLEYDQGHSLYLGWSIYAIAANGYRKAGLYEKAFNLLKKSEEHVSYKARKTAFCSLMTHYATIGKKEEVMRLWNLYRKDGKIYKRGYLAIIDSLLKFDDFESAVKIFEEWESRKWDYDVRIPNLMIGAYCRRGNLEAAEAIVNRTIMSEGGPNPQMWAYLLRAYIVHGNFSKAFECIKQAISICELGSGWTRFQGSLAAILDHLKGKGDVEGAVELIRLLRGKDLLSLDVHNKLMNWSKDMESNVHAIDVLLGGDSHKQTNEVSEIEEAQINNEEDQSSNDFRGKVKDSYFQLPEVFRRLLRPFSSS